MQRFEIVTKIEDSGILGFNRKPIDPSNYNDEQKQQMVEDVAETFLKKSEKFTTYKVVSTNFSFGKLILTIDVN